MLTKRTRSVPTGNAVATLTGWFVGLALACSAESVAHAEDCAPPSPAATVEAALAASGLTDIDPDALRRRARAASVLPESARLELRATDGDVFRVESRLDQDFDELLASDGADVTDVQRSGADSLLEVRVVLTWELSAIVWSDVELGIERVARDVRAERSELVDRTLSLYFDWRAAMAETGDDRPPHAAAEEAEIRARLGALTGGWFTRAAACASDTRGAP